MNSQGLRSELIDRAAQHRRLELGELSDKAYAELRAAVAADPEAFLTRDDDRAFAMVVRAVAANEEAQASEELIDDDEAFNAARNKRLGRLYDRCEQAFQTFPGTYDALAMMAMVRSTEPDVALEKLRYVQSGHADAVAEARRAGGIPEVEVPEGTDAWEVADERPKLRLLSSIARAQAETGRYRHACETCKRVIEASPSDMTCARYTWAICLARLEEEAAFDELDARFGRQGNAWTHLARTLLLFKLGRMPAARRALKGYASLCRGGAYALLRPTFVEPYLPDRPTFTPGSYEEAMLAVHECDPIVMDTPDFLAWASAQDGFSEQARQFARDNDYDW